MGERYWITGVQLGIIKARLTKTNVHEAIKTIEEVEDKQFISNFPTDEDKKRFIEQIKKIK